jgi:hypothetical protein
MEICTSYRTSVTQVSYSRLIFNTDIESSGSTVINSGNLQSGFWSSINLNTLVGVNPSPMIGLNAINASSTAVDIEWDLIHLNATGEPTFYWMSIGYWYIYIRICNTMSDLYLNISDGLCYPCPNGQYADSTTVQCESCNWICATCSISATNCTSCNTGRFFYPSGTTCNCLSPFVLNGQVCNCRSGQYQTTIMGTPTCSPCSSNC